VEITCRVYKPRRARESPLYRLVEQCLEDLLRLWPQRFARTHGPPLRGIFRKRRELLLNLVQCAAEAVAECVRRGVGADTRPGIVVSIATGGNRVQWHPQGHRDAVMKLLRERLLDGSAPDFRQAARPRRRAGFCLTTFIRGG
jgi:hypothetical protein